MKKGLWITSGVLASLALLGFIAVLLVGGGEKPSQPPVSVSESSATSYAADDYWGQVLSEFEAKKTASKRTSTTTTTEATKKTTTTTTEWSWMTDYTSHITVPSRTTNDSTTATTTGKAVQTTRTLTQAERDTVYAGVYDIVMESYNQYVAAQLEYISAIDAQIAAQEAAKAALYADYQKEVDALYERFKHEFIPIATLEASLRNTYQNNVATIESTISGLEAEKKSTQAALAQSEKELDAVIQAKYYEAVEELQRSTLS